MKKVVLSVLVGGILMLILNMVVSQIVHFIIPSIAQEYTNAAVFRPWTDPLMSLIFIYPFVLALVIFYVWDKTKKLFTSGSLYEKSFKFGLLFWLLTNVTGMLISYSTFPVSLPMILSWSLGSLAMSLGGALVVARIDK